ncbi:MAG: DoxX family protein [Fuerstiella sp.]
MTDTSRFSLAAIVLLVVLRLGIGWQLLYEGLWKVNTLDSPTPWTAAGYLKNSLGPMRDSFRNMAGDPDELGWLDYDTVAGRWQSWAARFNQHYELDEKQQGSLYRLMNGSQGKAGNRLVFSEPLEALPSGIEYLNKASRVSNKVVWFDAKAKRLYVDAEQFLKPDERAKLDALVKGRSDAQAAAFLNAVDRVYSRQKNGMGYLKKLAGALKGDPGLLGNEDWQQVGKLEQYKKELAEYEADYAAAKTETQWGHLNFTWGKIQSLRSELTGPIKAMESELKDKAEGILTTAQLAKGPVSEPWTALRISDTLTIIGLTVLGLMLILGLFTRFAAVMAAFMLFSFYLAMPPFPGVPEIPGPEHSFIVNKNLIEVFALLAIAALPSGIWFGLDRLLAVFFDKWKSGKKLSPALKSMVATGDEPDSDSGLATAAT